MSSTYFIITRKNPGEMLFLRIIGVKPAFKADFSLGRRVKIDFDAGLASV